MHTCPGVGLSIECEHPSIKHQDKNRLISVFPSVKQYRRDAKTTNMSFELLGSQNYT